VSDYIENGDFQKRAEQVEQLIAQISTIADEKARSTALELVQSLMDLHGAAITRMVEVLRDSGESGRNQLVKLGKDPLICGLLVLYGVHPLTLEQRVQSALEIARPQLRKHNATVELREITDVVIQVKIDASGHGCGSSPDAIKQIVEQAVREAAPEVVEIVAEGVTSTASGFVPVSGIQPAKREEKEYEESTT
jgi:Fe-S cluster biogenesis protein NfuA